MKPSLDNIEAFSIPLLEHPLKWKFEEGEGSGVSPEFEDQIIPLNEEGTHFLWKFFNSQKIFRDKFIKPEYFTKREEYFSGDKSEEEVKKWLYNRGIPFDNKVFWVPQPKWGFVLTWKMVIKFSHELFFGTNELIWDRTLNWVLTYDHNEAFYFAKDRIFNTEIEQQEKETIKRIIDEAGE
ncbi:MAG: hypothetical protein AAFO07_02685 [Bacteroidota bacterium]